MACQLPRTTRLAPLALAVLVALSCHDSTGPAFTTGNFALAPRFESAAAGIVTISAFRAVLRRTADNSVALDTVIAVPADADSVSLALTVRMLTASETFSLTLALITPAGDTAFRAGPTIVKPEAGGAMPPPVTLDLRYAGVGADAKGVRIVTADPRVFFGDSTTLVAEAYDSSGTAIPGTPIAWASLDTLTARVPAADVGTVRGGSQRGQARITATLLTGPSDTAAVLVQPVPARAAVESGNNQSGPVTTTLPQPLQVRVTAADSLGVSGVPVQFQITSGGGTLDLDSGLTDDSGRVAIHWTLGVVAGAQAARARILAAIPDSVLALSATGIAGALQSLTVHDGDGQSGTVGSPLATAPSVVVHDSLGNPVPGAAVTFQVTAGGGSLTGATPTSDASGVARVGSWTLGTVVGANALRAFALRGPGDTLSVSFSATGVAGAATTLLFTTQPDTTPVNAAIAPFQVTAFDTFNNLATGFTDAVSLSFQNNPTGGSLGGTVTVTPVNGIATFSNVSVTVPGSRYALQAATATGVVPAVSQPFVITPVGMTHLWTGALSTDWATGGNWNVGKPPSAATDVVFIPATATNQPTLSTAGVSVGDLYVENGATLTVSGVTLTVAGNLEAGNTIIGTGTLSMTGVGKTLRGTVPNLSIESTADITALGVVNVTGTGTQYVWGHLAFAVDGTKTVMTVAGSLDFEGDQISMHEDLDTLSVATHIEICSTPNDTSVTGGVITTPDLDEDCSGFRAFGTNKLLMAGTGSHYMTFYVTSSRLQDVEITDQDTVSVYDMTIGGNLTISGSADFDAGSNIITVGGNLTTTGSGVLTMPSSGSVSVQGNAVFQGGSTAGRLTAGTLSIAGNFQQGGSNAQSFSADPGHLTSFTGSAAQQITFGNPGPSTSHFGDLRLAQPAGSGVSLLSTADATGLFRVPGDTLGAQTVIGGGQALTVGGVDLDYLTLDHALFTWDGVAPFSGTYSRLWNTTFTNYLDSEVQFYIYHPGLSGSGYVSPSNLTFKSLANPINGGYYMKVEDYDGTVPDILNVSTFFFLPTNLPAETSDCATAHTKFLYLHGAADLFSCS